MFRHASRNPSSRSWNQLIGRSITAALAALTASALAIADDAPALTLEDLYQQPSLFGSPPSAPKWSPDGQRFAFLWRMQGRGEQSLWLAAPPRFQPIPIEPGGFNPFTVREFTWHPNGNALYVLHDDELWVAPARGATQKRLANLGSSATDLSLSPDGRSAAYLKDGNVWIYDIESGVSTALTNLGIAPLSRLESATGSSLPAGRYSRREREIGPGIWGGPRYAWAPDSQTIAVHIVDRRGMREVPFPNYLAPETAPNPVRRGYPGDANESRQVGLLTLSDKRDSAEMRVVPLPDPTAHQIVGFDWSAQGALLVDVASDTAEDRWLYVLDKGAEEARSVWHGRRPSRIYTAFASTWHSDGRHIVFLSDLEDRYGLYLLDASAEQPSPRRLSDATADVLSAPFLSADGSRLFYASNAAGSHEQQIYSQSLDPGAVPDRVSTRPGHHTPYPSPDGRHLAVMHSSASTPPELYLYKPDDNEEQRVTRSPLPAFRSYQWVRTRYVTFAGADNSSLAARILEPANLDPRKKYPVLFGPMYSNTVRNRWSGRYSRIQQLLVHKGYIVVQVDMRGSTGYGRAFREAFLADFAGGDIEDIAATVDYLKTIPYMDTERMGIWGSSYGGTLSVYTLLKKPGLFRAGVAAAAAVDPAFFGTDDVAIVRRPESQPDIFLNRAEAYVDQLQDHLLLIHGMQDQVVPFKTTAALAEALIRAGKDFDFAFAPGATHAWSREAYYSPYLFRKMLQHFDRYLQPEQQRWVRAN